MRLQRFLARAGITSRRKAEELILAGRVRVNGVVVRELGSRVDPRRDRIDFDNQRVQPEDHVWLLLNKPAATVSTVDDPQGRPTVLDLLGPQSQRLYPVGRLDYHTQGALLLTNDGALAHALMHPSNQVPRVYQVKVRGIIAPEVLASLRDGVTLDTGETVAAAAARHLGTTGRHSWLEFTLHQGLNRQIHRMMQAVDLEVLRLIRVSFAGLTIDGLQPGQHRVLGQREVNLLRTQLRLRRETVRRTDASRPPRAESRRGEHAPRRPPAAAHVAATNTKPPNDSRSFARQKTTRKSRRGRS